MALRRSNQMLLLPHGVTVKRADPAQHPIINTDDDVSLLTTDSKAFGVKILSHEEVQRILHSNMMCAPVPRTTSNELLSDAGKDDVDLYGDYDYEDDESSLQNPTLFKTNNNKSQRSKNKQGKAVHNNGNAGGRQSKTSGVAASTQNDTDRLMHVQMDTSSTLGGDTLDNVNSELQRWLTGLADACPLNLNEDMWQTKKRLAATQSLHLQAEHDDHDNDDGEDGDDEYITESDPFVIVERPSKNKNKVTSKNKKESQSFAQVESLPPAQSQTTTTAAKVPLSLSLSQQLQQSVSILESVFSESQKYSRTECGRGGGATDSELDNVIQRLAMVHQRGPLKSHPSNDKFKFTISPLPVITNPKSV